MPGPNGNPVTYTLNYSDYTAATTFASPVVDPSYYLETARQGTSRAALLTSIVLPNGTSYGFSYDNFLNLTSITLPTGGTITYQWQTQPWGPCDIVNNQQRVIQKRILTDANGNTATWSYAITPPAQTASGQCTDISTTITDPNLNDEAHSFSTNQTTSNNVVTFNTVETISSYQGSQSTGTLLKTVALQRPLIYLPFVFPDQYEPSVAYGPTTLKTETWAANNKVSQTSYQLTPQNGTAVYYDYTENTVGPGTTVGTDYSAAYLPLNSQQVTSVQEYDYGAGKPGALLRTTTTQYQWQSTPSYATANLLDIVASIAVTDGSGNPITTTTYNYDEAGSPQGSLGNLTAAYSNGIPLASSVYNSDGSVQSTSDGKGNKTTFAYQCSGSALQSVTNALGQITSYGYDCNTGLKTSVTDANHNQTSYGYDSSKNIISTTLPNGGSSTVDYGGYAVPLTVTTTTAASPNPNIVNQATYDGLGRLIHSISSPGDETLAVHTDTTYDGLGRVVSISNPYNKTNDPTYGITSYIYDALGRKMFQCQPDNSSQPTATCTPSNSYQSWSYSGNVVTFQNELGNHWSRQSDGLSRLTKVLEPDPTSGTPSIETDYTYDSLSNLTRVDQWGGAAGSAGERARTFTYDGLSRLINASNPETGNVSYSYVTSGGGLCSGDPSSVCVKTDARGVATNYTYDALNRITGKTYSSDVTGTPAVTYGYDTAKGGWSFPDQSVPVLSGVSQTNLIGRLSYESNSYSTIVYGYDPLGRTTLKSVCTPLTCGVGDHFDLHYQYDLAGDIKSSDIGLDAVKNAATPSAGFYYGGLSLGYNSVGQLMTATADTVDPTHPASIASGLQYSPLGGVTSLQFGSVYGEGDQYTPRGWLLQRYGTDTTNNLQRTGTLSHDGVGNVTQLLDSYLGATTFTYDQLNRLTSFSNPYVGVTYGFDAWGNMTTHTQTVGAGYNFSLSYSPNNQTTQAGSTNGGLTYDAAGDVLSDGLNSYGYDGEGRLLSVDGSTTYLYGPDGTRVATSQGGSATSEYLYDLNNTLVTTLGTDGKMVRGSLYGGNMHLADYTAGTGAGGGHTEFRFTDEVNSLAFVLDQDGNILESCSQNPFGESLHCNGPSGTPIAPDFSETHFTDKKRDAESGLDYFGARYYGSLTGRFMSPDPLGGHLENPQSLNKYAYALNNPLTNTDPTGLDSYLQCQTASSTCASQTVGYDSKGNAQTALVQGVTGQNGQFTATQIGNDANGNLVDKTTGTGSYTASVNGSGVQFSNNGGQSSSTGVFVNGTPQTTFQDAGFASGGALSGFNFTLTNSKLEANQTEAGYFSFGGTPGQAGAALQQAGFQHVPGTEDGNEYRSSGNFLTGANSGHFIVNPNILLDPGVTLPTAGGAMHFGEHNVWGGIGGAGLILHCASDRAGYCQ